MNKSVVELTELQPSVAMITMQDRQYKNTFSPGLVQGLVEKFAEVKNNLNYKAVILTGYDNYFASGGTQEALLDIHDRKVNFTDVNIYSLALDCPIPVIAAMQGHGIGGGFVMGLFADVVILNSRSIYTANFMKYGFTPGMGATFILPAKLGISLAEEMLLSAANYFGEDLARRGIPFPVLSKQEVMEFAINKAQEFAQKPRLSLVTLKDHLVSHLRKNLTMVIQQELDMHEKTFHQPGVKENIMELFGQ